MRNVLYSSAFVPPELIRAHSFEPVFGAAGRGQASEPVSECAGVCEYMRAFINEASQATEVAAVIVTTECDQMRRGCEFAHRSAPPPTFLLNVPASGRTAAMQAAYLSELRRLDRFLGEVGGGPVSAAELCRTMLACEAERGASARVESNPGRIPLAVIGAHSTCTDEVLEAAIEACGGHIVLIGMEHGERGRPARFKQSVAATNPLAELARAYFDTIPGIFQRPNEPLFEWLRDSVARSGARGVVLVRQQWCDLWHAEVPRLREALDVPLLDLDIGGTELDASNRMRLQALLETLRFEA